MVKKTKSYLFQGFILGFLYLLAGQILVTPAYADNTDPTYNPLKPVYIQAAQSGDADALYQLGLIYAAEGSPLSDQVSTRFFHHAAEAGHVEAGMALAKTRTISESANLESLQADTRRSKNLIRQTTVQRPDTDDVVANSIIKVPTQSTMLAESPALPTAINSTSDNLTTSSPIIASEIPSPGVQPVELIAGLASSTEAARSEAGAMGQIAAEGAGRSRATLMSIAWPVFMSIFGFCALVLIYRLIQGVGKIPAAVRGKIPEDFNLEAYLLWNPDVERSGINPYIHYAQYGHSEGRLYKF